MEGPEPLSNNTWFDPLDAVQADHQYLLVLPVDQGGHCLTCDG
jgi:hypothetical protein